MTSSVATPSTETRSGAVLALACAAQFVVVLDVAVVNVALPSIRADLGLGADALHWVVVAYTLLLGSFLLLGGRICDTFGRRTALTLGLVIFTLASAGAGAAPNEAVLLAARALQGLGAALIPPAALATIAITFTDQAARSRALGLYGAVTGMSASVGVIASGLITEHLGWRWVFLVNLPIGITMAVAAVALLPRERPRVEPMKNGVASSLAVSAGIFLLILGLSESSTHGWLRVESIASLLVALLLLASFGWLERRDPTPLVPHEIRRRPVLSSAATAFFLFAALLSFIFLGSLLMQQLLAYSSATTGLAWLAMTATSFVAAALTGTKLLPLVGVRPLMLAGLVLLATAAIVAGFAGADAHYVTGVMPALILAGTAGGLAAPAVQLGALTGVPDHAAGIASGLLETMRDLGGSVGIAAVATALASAGSSGTGLADAFQNAYWIVAALAIAGAVTAWTTLPSTAHHPPEGSAMNTSYSTEIAVPASPEETLAAVHDPRSWWSEGITGRAGATGDEFDYRYGTVHRCRVRIVESGPQRVVWEILENEFGVLDGEDEWVGTRCVFELEPVHSGTVLRFTHDGLYPHFACYEVCSQGWDHYIRSSLAAALTHGTGAPNAAHTARADHEVSDAPA